MKEHGSPTRVKSGRNKQMRTRDYVIKGNGLEHGSKRRVSCAEGFGAVEGTKDMIAYNRQKIRCVNGAWEPQELVCSTCFDAPSVGKFAWRDERGNDCLYYSSRPMECLKSEQRTEEEKMADDSCKEILFDGQSTDPKTFECDDAKARCRIACRTCPQAQEKYRVKAIMKSIKSINAGGVAVSGVEHPESWTRKFMKILVGHQREIKSQRRVKVAKRIKKA
jgi:hypothetical protein